MAVFLVALALTAEKVVLHHLLVQSMLIVKTIALYSANAHQVTSMRALVAPLKLSASSVTTRKCALVDLLQFNAQLATPWPHILKAMILWLISLLVSQLKKENTQQHQVLQSKPALTAPTVDHMLINVSLAHLVLTVLLVLLVNANLVTSVHKAHQHNNNALKVSTALLHH